MAGLGAAMSRVGASEAVTRRTAETFGVLDVAGMNYMDSRYELDRDRFPNRIILGTETFPAAIGRTWPLVRDNPHVLGDFTWTGWDYLGEAGIGRTHYPSSDGPWSILGAYPWLTAHTGDLDITGIRRPASYYREIVFGLRPDPYIAVQRPDRFGEASAAGPWSWSDSIAGWSWPGSEGRLVHVEVYSDADEVELQCNGMTVGRAPAGEAHDFRAEFDIEYEPGELLAIASVQGTETGRCRLVSACGDGSLRAVADRVVLRADASDLAFVEITLADDVGTVAHTAHRTVSVQVAGPAVLQALGSADPGATQAFTGTTTATYDGRALAVIRPTGTGSITVTVSAPGDPAVVLALTASEAGPAADPLVTSADGGIGDAAPALMA